MADHTPWISEVLAVAAENHVGIPDGVWTRIEELFRGTLCRRQLSAKEQGVAAVLLLTDMTLGADHAPVDK